MCRLGILSVAFDYRFQITFVKVPLQVGKITTKQSTGNNNEVVILINCQILLPNYLVFTCE